MIVFNMSAPHARPMNTKNNKDHKNIFVNTIIIANSLIYTNETQINIKAFTCKLIFAD
jgi:hypothetical protein